MKFNNRPDFEGLKLNKLVNIVKIILLNVIICHLKETDTWKKVFRYEGPLAESKLIHSLLTYYLKWLTN